MATLAQRLLDLASRVATEFNTVRADIATAIATVGSSNQGTVQGLVSGGGVVNTSGLTFEVTAASYYIDGALVTSAGGQTVTLAAADATNPRIDLLILDDTGTFVKITGTAAANPSAPAYDPNTQLYLTFVLVPATATTLAGITTTDIYLEDAEWTSTTSGAGFTKASTNNPYAGTKDIEGTNVTAGSYVELTAAAPISFDGEGNLVFRIRSKAAWANKRSLQIQWRLSGVAKGQALTLKSGAYGFDSSSTAAYQLVVIPKSDFAIPAGTNVDKLRITDAGGAIGFYIDNIQLQNVSSTTGGGGATGGITQTEGDARYARRDQNLADLTDQSFQRRYIQLLAGSDYTTVLTTGDGKDCFAVPADFNGWNLVDVIGVVLTPSTSGIPTFQIARVRGGTPADVLTTKLTIDANEYGSSTAATPKVIDTSKDDLATNDVFRLDCDVAGTTTAGVMVILVIQKPMS